MMPFDRDLRDLLRATKALSQSPADNIQRQLETELEAAERRVREAEARVAKQREIVQVQRATGEVDQLSQDMLANLELLLNHHLLHLSRFRPPQPVRDHGAGDVTETNQPLCRHCQLPIRASEARWAAREPEEFWHFACAEAAKQTRGELFKAMFGAPPDSNSGSTR